jgi:exodeoxyribonuclease V gamma subunit
MLNLWLYTSNRLETLAETLAEHIRKPLRSPLAPETILVQSQGMARWLQLRLAEHLGACGNCLFPFPRAFSYEAFKAVLPSLFKETACDQDALVWRIMERLPGYLGQPEFRALNDYLGAERDARKLFQLAERIAYVFDQYLVFRPDLIRQWDSGGDQDWQAKLWRDISAPFREQHPAALQAKFLQHLEQASVPILGLPERIAVFGVSALPPVYLQVLRALARHIEVSMYLLQPCEQFWGYISSEREQEQLLRRAGKGASEAGQMHLEKGNRLLASMGKLGRDFLLLLQDTGEWQEAEPSLFAAPVETHLLAQIQADILNLEDRGQPECPRMAVSDNDASLQVHSCHSPLRELEVLHDHLLSWFENDPELAPRDILVMIPEIELYAPYIQAVFGSPEHEAFRIPFSIADGITRAQSKLVETFFSLLQLSDSRLGASRVLALLEAAPVRRKFRLAEDDLELVRHWLEEVRIRWGQDQQHRAELGLPAWSENTWRHGLDRLLLGCAMAGNGEQLFEGILPYDDLEGSATSVLGSLAEFLERLFAALKSLKVARSLRDWVAMFQSLLDNFFELREEDALEVHVLSATFEKLARAAASAGFEQVVELPVILEKLDHDLAEDHFGAGYLTGGITFCALKPMRSIPAKVICLLGMNDRSFPRTSPQLSFDLMTQQRRLGDRSSRDDDRYLFLETLISARERLYISYVGQSVRDNRPAPPSVLVSELMDYVAQGFELQDKDIIQDHILTRHRLQAFSPGYFDGGRLFSYSRENLKASQVLSPERKSQGGLVRKPLAAPDSAWRQLSLQTFADFLCNPAKFLAVNRLGLRLPSKAASMDEREAFKVPGLDSYQIRQELLALKLNNISLGRWGDLIRASGRLPAGIAGEAYLAQLRRDVEVFHTRLREFEPQNVEQAKAFELAIGGFNLSGSFTHLTPNGLLFYRPAVIKAKDLIRAWVEHLLWNAERVTAGQMKEPWRTVIVGTESVWNIAPALDPLPVLEGLLDRYWSGLSEPLKFFPESSFAFAAADLKASSDAKGKTTRTPLDFALEKWCGNEFGAPGECENEYIALFFRNSDALDSDFEAHARAVFRPLLALSEEMK